MYMVLRRYAHDSSHGQQAGTTVVECLYANGVLVHVVTDVINSKATDKLYWDYNWKLDFNSCLSASETGSVIEKVVVKWWT